MQYLENHAACGYAWPVDDWKRLDRFLLMGSEDGTYEAGKTRSRENTAAVRRCLRADGMRVVRTLVDNCGKLPLKEPALRVLALASSPEVADAPVNAAALAALPVLARTAADLCKYAAFVEETRGWGRRLRSAIADWYVGKPVKELTRQVLKGSNRTGWSHGDLLRLAHPKTPSAAHNVLFDWAVNGVLKRTRPMASDLAQLYAFERAKDASDSSEIVRIIEDERLTYEMLPQQWLNDADVWEALLYAMPYATLVRSLGRMTAVGLIAPQSHAAALVVARLIDRGRITASNVQPMALLSALHTYKWGRAGSGKLRWKPVASVMDALDEAFYLAIGNVEPAGKRLYVAIDASVSMQTSMIGGQPGLSAAAASAAMALVLARTEPNCHITAFHEELWHMSIGRRDRIDEVCKTIPRAAKRRDGTLPMLDAARRGMAVDGFVILTGSSAWEPDEALRRYRETSGLAAKLVTVQMTASHPSFADCGDALQVNVAGFDTAVPAIVKAFLDIP